MTFARRRRFFVFASFTWWIVSGCGGAGTIPLLADAAPDGGGGNSSDASSDASAVSCSCGPTQTCCLYTSGAGSVNQQVCATTCAPPDGGHLSSLACTGSDCPGGEVCCLWRNGNDNVSQCKTSCSSQNNEVQMCNSALVDPGCPSSQPCSSNNITDWNLTPPLATCGGQGVP